MKTEKILLLFLLIPLVGIIGCDQNDAPPDVPTESVSALFLAGKVWQLDGILDLETNAVRKLETGDNAGIYSIHFQSNSTGSGKILNTEMLVSLSSPFFYLSEEKEKTEETQLFAQIAEGITRCEYHFEDSLMRFYNEDLKTCLVFKFKSVRDKTGTIFYEASHDRWIIRGDSGAEAGTILIDSGEAYLSEDIPDNLKRNDIKVKFSGDITRIPPFPIFPHYSINLTSLEELH
ncbi:MAG: hypothetical protein LBB84_08215 [Tannerellaceae bacterium]|nr:hypothetical protein [Tannerellaceae bacterium]